MHFLEFFFQDTKLARAMQEIGLNRLMHCLQAASSPSWWRNGSCRTRAHLETDSLNSVLCLEIIYHAPTLLYL